MNESTTTATTTVSLRVVLTSMVLLVAIVATIVAFVPLYTVSMSSATGSAEEFSQTIATDIGEKISMYFTTMQNVVSVMSSAAMLGGWTEDKNGTATIRPWMNYAVTRGG